MLAVGDLDDTTGDEILEPDEGGGAVELRRTPIEVTTQTANTGSLKVQ
jgi:hypothetical protein